MNTRFPEQEAHIHALVARAADHFGDIVSLKANKFMIKSEGQPLTRIIARFFDAYDMSNAGHASAI